MVIIQPPTSSAKALPHQVGDSVARTCEYISCKNKCLSQEATLQPRQFVPNAPMCNVNLCIAVGVISPYCFMDSINFFALHLFPVSKGMFNTWLCNTFRVLCQNHYENNIPLMHSYWHYLTSFKQFRLRILM